jgi:type IV pilus assembly protein PilM
MDISNLTQGLGKLFAFGGKKESVIGLDIGSSSVKLVEIKQKGDKIELLKYGTLALGPFANGEIGGVAKLPPKKLIEAVKTAFTAVGVLSNRGGITIPIKSSLVVTIDVPKAAEKKLDTVIPYEARRYIPVPPSEVNIAWSIISTPETPTATAPAVGAPPEKKADTIKVLVAAIHNTTIANYQEIATGVGLAPSILEIETFSAIRSIFGNIPGTYALCDMGSDVTKIIIVDHGSIAVSHSIDRGSWALTLSLSQTLNISVSEAEKIKRKEGMTGSYNGTPLENIMRADIDYIIGEVGNVIGDYEKKQSKKIEKVVFIGGGASLRGFMEKAVSHLNHPASIGNPFAQMVLPTPVLAPILKEAGPEYAASVGIAMRALSEL